MIKVGKGEVVEWGDIEEIMRILNIQWQIISLTLRCEHKMFQEAHCHHHRKRILKSDFRNQKSDFRDLKPNFRNQKLTL